MIGGDRTRRVSIVTPFLNAARFIDETIESVLAQTYDDWELLLVDDGSTDASSAIARDYARRHPDRIDYVEHADHANLGTAASRNVGAKRSVGLLLAYLDADDVWLPHKLERQVALLDANPLAAMVYGASQYWYSWSGADTDACLDHVCDVGVPPETVVAPPELLRLMLDDGIHTPGPSDLMIRRSALERSGGFEEAFVGPLQLYEDQAFLAKVYLHEQVLVSTECWDRYRIHDESCDSMVVESGSDTAVRRYFFNWLHDYLASQPPSDGSAGLIEQARSLALATLEEAEGDVARSGETRRLKWWLRSAERSAATLVPLDPTADAVRVTIAVNGQQSYDVQLNVARVAVKTGHAYALSFSVRSDSPRHIHVAVSRAYEPWTSLGHYQRVDVHDSWQAVTQRFMATDRSTNARIHFDIGEHAGAVEVSDVRLRNLTEGVAVEPDIPRPAAPGGGPRRSSQDDAHG